MKAAVKTASMGRRAGAVVRLLLKDEVNTGRGFLSRLAVRRPAAPGRTWGRARKIVAKGFYKIAAAPSSRGHPGRQKGGPAVALRGTAGPPRRRSSKRLLTARA